MNGTPRSVLVHAHLQPHRPHAGGRHLPSRNRQAVVEEGDERKERRQQEQRQAERQDEQRDPDRRGEERHQNEIERQRENPAGAHAGERIGGERRGACEVGQASLLRQEQPTPVRCGARAVASQGRTPRRPPGRSTSVDRQQAVERRRRDSRPGNRPARSPRSRPPAGRRGTRRGSSRRRREWRRPAL